MKFEVRGDDLYIEGHKVIRAWESYTGWYWFAFEEVQKQDSVIRGKVYKDDTIYYGLVQGFEEEFGDFSLAELERLKPMVWELPKRAFSWSGRRGSR